MNSTGIITNTSQAPWVNLVMVTTISTTKVSMAPNAVDRRGCAMMEPRFGGFVFSRASQWRTMPVWPSVNDTKTPMM